MNEEFSVESLFICNAGTKIAITPFVIIVSHYINQYTNMSWQYEIICYEILDTFQRIVSPFHCTSVCVYYLPEWHSSVLDKMPTEHGLLRFSFWPRAQNSMRSRCPRVEALGNPYSPQWIFNDFCFQTARRWNLSKRMHCLFKVCCVQLRHSFYHIASCCEYLLWLAHLSQWKL